MAWHAPCPRSWSPWLHSARAPAITPLPRGYAAQQPRWRAMPRPAPIGSWKRRPVNPPAPSSSRSAGGRNGIAGTNSVSKTRSPTRWRADFPPLCGGKSARWRHCRPGSASGNDCVVVDLHGLQRIRALDWHDEHEGTFAALLEDCLDHGVGMVAADDAFETGFRARVLRGFGAAIHRRDRRLGRGAGGAQRRQRREAQAEKRFSDRVEALRGDVGDNHLHLRVLSGRVSRCTDPKPHRRARDLDLRPIFCPAVWTVVTAPSPHPYDARPARPRALPLLRNPTRAQPGWGWIVAGILAVASIVGGFIPWRREHPQPPAAPRPH